MLNAMTVALLTLAASPDAKILCDGFDADTMGDWQVADVGTHAAPSKWFIADGAIHQTSNIYKTLMQGRHPEREWMGTLLVWRKSSVADGLLETEFWSTDDDGIGCVWRYRDPDNYYQFQIDGSAKFWQLTRRANGTFTCLASGDEFYVPKQRYQLQVRFRGVGMVVFLDGRVLCAVEDDTLASGRVGLVSRGNAGSHFGHVRLAPASEPIEATAVRRYLSHHRLSQVNLDRAGYRPGEHVTLTVGEALRKREPRCTIALLDPNGRIVARPTLDPTTARPRIWEVPAGTAGVHTIRVSLDDHARRDLPFNVWSGRPAAGACAHRGDCRVAPENTMPAIRLAVEKGAHQIEFDVQMSKDGRLVIMHDHALDRTTNGKGPVRDLTFDELRRLDAGSWKGEQFCGTKIPTFREVVQAVPPQILLNCHLRHAPGLAAKVTRQIVEMGRLDQCFLACGTQQAAEARAVCTKIKICNMSGQRGPNSDYPDRTIAMRADFIQLHGWHDSMPAVVAKLRKHGITVNYFGTDEAPMMRRLIESGVNYILTDSLDVMLKVLAEYGVEPVRASKK